MYIKFENSYPLKDAEGNVKKDSKTGRNRMGFKYTVHGTKAELEAYKDAQGEFYREDDDKTPLYFTSKPIGKSGVIKISSEGNVFIDSSEMDLASSLIENFGEAGRIMAMDMLKGNQPVNHQPQVTKQHIEDSESLDK